MGFMSDLPLSIQSARQAGRQALSGYSEKDKHSGCGCFRVHVLRAGMCVSLCVCECKSEALRRRANVCAMRLQREHSNFRLRGKCD